MTSDLSDLLTLRDMVRYAVTRFNEARLVFGHGTGNAVDEAVFIVLEALHLPIDDAGPWLDARLLPAERARLAALIEARIATRKPVAYLLNRAYIQGVPFYVDERVIVPRSYIGELIAGPEPIVGEDALLGPADAIAHVLDLCCGSGCLAILAAKVFPAAAVDAVDLSAGALEVARRNVEDHGLASRITLHEGDLFSPLAGRRYDLIVANPPYVAAAEIAAFPPEHRAEPELAHAGGADGLDIVRRILAAAPGHLTPRGALVMEIGTGRARLEASFPGVAFLWLDTAESEGEVLLVTRADLEAATAAPVRRPAARRKKP